LNIQIKLETNTAQQIVWFNPGGTRIDGRFTSASIQIVGEAWGGSGVFTLVTRVATGCEPIALAGAATFTISAKNQFGINITNVPDLGLKLTTAEGSDLTLIAHVYFGDKPWPSA